MDTENGTGLAFKFDLSVSVGVKNFNEVDYTNTTDMANGIEQLRWPIGPLQKSKFLHGPGYYECRCRLQQKPGWWSAFWIQSPVIGASADPADTDDANACVEQLKSSRFTYKRNLPL